MTRLILVLLLLTPTAVSAQPPVDTLADRVSWATAAVNPVWGAVDAARGPRPGCHLGQLALSLSLASGGAALGQHFITSPRPCCAGNGLPSAHAAIGWVGLAQPSIARGYVLRWSIGLTTAGATPILRVKAHRHTAEQAIWGSLLGVGSELASHLLRCE